MERVRKVTNWPVLAWGSRRAAGKPITYLIAAAIVPVSVYCWKWTHLPSRKVAMCTKGTRKGVPLSGCSHRARRHYPVHRSHLHALWRQRSSTLRDTLTPSCSEEKNTQSGSLSEYQNYITWVPLSVFDSQKVDHLPKNAN